jgi:hypothetical protein
VWYHLGCSWCNLAVTGSMLQCWSTLDYTAASPNVVTCAGLMWPCYACTCVTHGCLVVPVLVTLRWYVVAYGDLALKYLVLAG